ncbi:MAG TPA: hypothetical protein VFZ98_13780, partial [Vicinamibacterales bacterium]
TVLLSAVWAVSPHVSDIGQEQDRLFARVAFALFLGGAMYILYLGLEPFVRRAWPDMLVGWTRFVGGRFHDPIVGHDVLIGVACGAALALLNLATVVVPPMLGLSEPQPHTTDFSPLFGARGTALMVLNCMNLGMQNMLITTFEFAGFRALFELAVRKGWKRSTLGDKKMEALFIALAMMTVALVSALGSPNPNLRLLDALYQSISIAVVLNVLLRIGIFSATVMFMTNFVLLRMPFTFDSSAFYSAQGWFALALLLGLAVVGYWMALNPPTLPAMRNSPARS